MGIEGISSGMPSIQRLYMGNSSLPRVYGVAHQILQDGLSLETDRLEITAGISENHSFRLDTASDALMGYSDVMGRLHTLSIQAQDPFIGQSGRDAIQAEADGLLSELSAYSDKKYMGQPLLEGDEMATGGLLGSSYTDVDFEGIYDSVKNIDLTSQAGGASAADTIGSALSDIHAGIASTGASQARMMRESSMGRSAAAIHAAATERSGPSMIQEMSLLRSMFNDNVGASLHKVHSNLQKYRVEKLFPTNNT